jgi:hypothetical protein
MVSEFLEGGVHFILSFLWMSGVLFKEWRTCSSWAWSGVGGLLRLCWRKKKRNGQWVCHLGKKGLCAKNSLDRLVEYALEISLRQGGALEVLDGLDLFGDLDCLLILYGLHLALAQLLLDLWVVAQVELGADEDDGDAGRVVLDLGVPL